MLKNKADF